MNVDRRGSAWYSVQLVKSSMVQTVKVILCRRLNSVHKGDMIFFLSAAYLLPFNGGPYQQWMLILTEG